jgi:hypothetical protein
VLGLFTSTLVSVNEDISFLEWMAVIFVTFTATAVVLVFNKLKK